MCAIVLPSPRVGYARALMAAFLAVVAFASPSLGANRPPLTADNFGERFEASHLAGSLKANAYKGECKDGFGRTCNYSIRTTTVDVQSREDGNGLRSVTINCVACKGEHLLFILPMIIRLVLPNLPPKMVGACMDASTRSIDTLATETVDLGSAQFLASRRGKELTMTLAFKD